MTATVLLVGLGQIGMMYDLLLDPDRYVYTHARAFSRHPGFRLTAGVDPDQGLRRTFTDTYGVAAYPDVATALDSHQPDIVVIAVPTRLHGSVLRDVLARARPQIVLCEKPLSYDLVEAERMVHACAASGIFLYVNYIRRSDPGVVEVRRRIEAAEIEAPIKGVAWYAKGFIHNGSHLLNLLEYWLGPTQRVTVMSPGPRWDDVDSQPDVYVTFPRGAVMVFSAGEPASADLSIQLVSPSGRLRYEENGWRIEWQQGRNNTGGAVEADQAGVETIDSDMNRYQLRVVRELARVLDHQDAHLCSASEALQTLASMSNLPRAC